MNCYILAHGFGFTNEYWRNLVPLLNGCVSYFGDSDIDPDKTYIGIGHSLGFLKLNNSGLKFSLLIGLQGFLNYCGNNCTLRKNIEPEVDRVIAGFNSDPSQSLRNFYTMCGYFEDLPNKVDGEVLISELKMMKKSYQHCGAKTVILGTERDVVVPKALINDNFTNIDNVSVKILDLDVNHTLGFHCPEVVVETIDTQFNLLNT